jgi:ribosomal protein L37E
MSKKCPRCGSKEFNYGYCEDCGYEEELEDDEDE